ncbi:MAG: AMMECR1 domain-containing protein [Treponema sp.]|nr:AMMECR1 domain-containing protein [Treponema sp.]
MGISCYTGRVSAKSISAQLTALLLLSALILPTLSSCTAKVGKPVYFLSDRHGLSYDIVEDYCEKTGCSTLVLFDKHNDVSADSSIIHSYDWAGQLVDRGIIQEVWWVCQYSADGLELSAKRKWLEKNTERKDEDKARRVLEAFRVIDFAALKRLKIKKPYAVTVDLDLYDRDREAEPEATAADATDLDSKSFIQETCAFLRKHKCPLVTVSLSAAYQKSPQKAWGYLKAFMQKSPKNARWLFTSGNFGEREESNEDLVAFARWKEKPDLYQGYQCGFYRGAYLWLNAPPAIQELFVRKNVTAYDADDSTSATVLQAMQDKLAIGKELAPYSQKEQLEGLHRIALKALTDSFSGKTVPPPDAHFAFDDKHSRGIAVRYRTAEKDRGCLALYSGLDFTAGDAEKAAGYASVEAARDPRYDYIRPEELANLFINISLFSYWEEMQDYEDFIPGLDSLLLVNPDAESSAQRETLLQASLAMERGYSKKDFLRRLSLKAGLDADGYKSGGIKFYKAKTISYTAKVIQ